ncbi:MAG: hypothetical protein Q9162_003533 [Coniocarpon cinnabarinum]
MSTRITEQDKDANPEMAHPESDYKDASGEVPVDQDAPVAEPDEEKANSDEQLQQDEKEAIDKSNIVEGGRTRGKPAKGQMKEPEGDADLVNEDGT